MRRGGAQPGTLSPPAPTPHTLRLLTRTPRPRPQHTWYGYAPSTTVLVRWRQANRVPRYSDPVCAAHRSLPGFKLVTCTGCVAAQSRTKPSTAGVNAHVNSHLVTRDRTNTSSSTSTASGPRTRRHSPFTTTSTSPTSAARSRYPRASRASSRARASSRSRPRARGTSC